MPARDKVHEAVRRALTKAGWTITADPLVLPFRGQNVYIDLAADSPIGAEKDGRKIAVEIKGFLSPSPTADLQQAVGQYRLYRFLLARQDPERQVVLAVPTDVESGVLSESDCREFLEEEGVKLLVFDPQSEEIVAWKD